MKGKKFRKFEKIFLFFCKTSLSLMEKYSRKTKTKFCLCIIAKITTCKRQRNEIVKMRASPKWPHNRSDSHQRVHTASFQIGFFFGRYYLVVERKACVPILQLDNQLSCWSGHMPRPENGLEIKNYYIVVPSAKSCVLSFSCLISLLIS